MYSLFIDDCFMCITDSFESAKDFLITHKEVEESTRILDDEGNFTNLKDLYGDNWLKIFMEMMDEETFEKRFTSDKFGIYEEKVYSSKEK